MTYNHQEIEKKWQEKWSQENVYKTADKAEGKENKYILVEFPYPSGNLHVGHWHAFSVTDIYVKYQRMLGYNVLFPIGFDAFGLPAENAAIKRKLNPRNWTYDNIDFMRNQLKTMGASFDWDREVITCSPEYYKWTQWLFKKFYEKGLIYQKEAYVNWCPSCKTVLANEQVIAGKCERCDSQVEQKEMKQWFMKITEYADRLVDDLDKLNWPNAIKEAQRNWIGRSEGSMIPFKLVAGGEKADSRSNVLDDFEVFTTRPDTLFGVTYVVFAPESKKVSGLLEKISNREDVEAYIKKTSEKTEMERIADNKEKTGVELKGISAINPVNGEAVPVWISDYVIATYGTGAVMAVPAHDNRDFEFAKKFNLPIRCVIRPSIEEKEFVKDGEYQLLKDYEYIINNENCFTENNGILINSEKFNGKNSDEVKKEITEFAGGKLTKNYRLRDWSVGRQRYWGCPIPIVHCKKCGAVPVNEDDLPVILPEIDDYMPSDTGRSPLDKHTEWKKVKCPKCGADSERETDTMDTFVDSSWYFNRYIDPKNEKEFAAKDALSKWMPVDFYSGGSEHTTMHLLFARFFHKVMFDLGLVAEDEPFKERLNRGLILGPDGNKMSKSKGNVIDPDQLVKNVGADSVRAYLAFIGPYNEAGSYPWDPNGVVGVKRFLERVYYLSEKIYKQEENNQTPTELETLLNQTIKKVGEDYLKLKFNTAISAMMIFVNLAEKTFIKKEEFLKFIILLAPVAPHLAEEIWHKLGQTDFVINQKWPDFDSSKLVNSEIEIAVQVNGKIRSKINVDPEMSENEIIDLAKNDEKVKKWLDGKDPKKVLYIKNKLVSIVY